MAIEVRGVSKGFGDVAALDDVSLEIPTGSLTALLGPSGCGKSTLLRVIAGLETPDAGTVLIDDENVTGLAPKDRGIGFCFQHYALFRHMTVWENIAFGLKVRHRPKEEISTKVAQLLDLVRLDGMAKRYPSQLSGGQRQRMALARALIVEPRVLLLDEPFGALDALVRKELRVWLRRLHDEVHVTTVLVTHDQEEAMEVADRLAVIDHGRLQQVGTPQQLYDEPVNDFVLTFVGPATSIRGEYVRPHDLSVSRAPAPGSHRANVLRVVHLGFEVRVELRLDPEAAATDRDGTDEDDIGLFAWAQLDRDSARLLDLAPGDPVHVVSSEPRSSSDTRTAAAAELGATPA
jgi:sulfate/thiosulfate transport system ATP-binding protein